MMLLRHLFRVAANLVAHGRAWRSPWIVVTVILIAAVAIVTAALNLVAPVVVYPFV